MKNLNLEIFNALVDSTEGLEVNFKVGKECELNILREILKRWRN